LFSAALCAQKSHDQYAYLHTLQAATDGTRFPKQAQSPPFVCTGDACTVDECCGDVTRCIDPITSGAHNTTIPLVGYTAACAEIDVSSTCTYTCASGFAPLGDVTVSCDASGALSILDGACVPTCASYTCGRGLELDPTKLTDACSADPCSGADSLACCRAIVTASASPGSTDGGSNAQVDAASESAIVDTLTSAPVLGGGIGGLFLLLLIIRFAMKRCKAGKSASRLERRMEEKMAEADARRKSIEDAEMAAKMPPPMPAIPRASITANHALAPDVARESTSVTDADSDSSDDNNRQSIEKPDNPRRGSSYATRNMSFSRRQSAMHMRGGVEQDEKGIEMSNVYEVARAKAERRKSTKRGSMFSFFGGNKKDKKDAGVKRDDTSSDSDDSSNNTAGSDRRSSVSGNGSGVYVPDSSDEDDSSGDDYISKALAMQM
jgi:hypothetical protein